MSEVIDLYKITLKNKNGQFSWRFVLPYRSLSIKDHDIYPSKEPTQIDVSFICVIEDIVDVVIFELLTSKNLLFWLLMLFIHYFFKSGCTWRQSNCSKLRFWKFCFWGSWLNFVLLLLWAGCLSNVFELLSWKNVNLRDVVTLILHVSKDKFSFISIVVL